MNPQARRATLVWAMALAVPGCAELKGGAAGISEEATRGVLKALRGDELTNALRDLLQKAVHSLDAPAKTGKKVAQGVTGGVLAGIAEHLRGSDVPEKALS